ncbi:hypothetical protein IFM89_015987 [Coptis chinensis]|uniref:Uncharacterized protein n=1 Tax=Coptis chinensis TaxID=261450 RepID=A0A835LVJ9_9MAGN|nr:hypothetical protein IFM89_015987 [Coptis chinensis]
MEGSWDGSLDTGSQSDDSFCLKRTHIEPIYDAFVCPLTKQLKFGAGPPETKLAMAAYLGELVLSNDVKVVARRVGSSLVNDMRSGNMQSREAALMDLNQISSSDTSAKVLIEAGILPPLVKDLFTVGANQLPARLKEVSTTILTNLLL